MKLTLVSTVTAFVLVLIVGLTLALVVQTSVQAVADADPDWVDDLSQPSADPASPSSVLGPMATGDLSVWKFSLAEYGGAAPGHPISYTIVYMWNSESGASAPNVQITDLFPSQVTISETNPPPSSDSGGTLVWNLGTLDNPASGSIIITGVVKSDVANGTIFTNTAIIAGDVTDQDSENNTAESSVEVKGAQPDLWLWKWGLLEELEEGFFFVTEQDAETTFELYYFNMSGFAGPDTTLVDDLPAGITYVGADPSPSQINGQQLIWDLGTVPAYGFGEVIVRVRPDQTGKFVNTATISSTIGDRDSSDNTDDFTFDVVSLLPPRLLKPNAQNASGDRPLIVGSNPRFEGLAKAGATVTLYEGSADGCYGDFSGCSPVALASTTAGLDRRWALTPTTMVQTRTYALYLRAELGGSASEPPYGYWTPLQMRIDPAFAGWDMDNFVFDTGGQESRPGGLGGTTGTTPNEPFTITIRQDLWDSVPLSPTLRAYHDLRLVISGSSSEPYTVTLPVSEFRQVPAEAAATAQSPADALSPLGRWAYDMFYVQHGFGPGSRIEVWCLPVYYPDDPDDIPLVGLVWTLCNEILVDPAGYVYDLSTTNDLEYDWPAVPPSDALITNATVTATVRSGDSSWARWEAEKTGQVNPQVTDFSSADGIKEPGYYAFYVPSGQYRVVSTAPNCLAYTSPILTVVDEPIFHNVGMRCGAAAQVGVEYDLFLPLLVR